MILTDARRRREALTAPDGRPGRIGRRARRLGPPLMALACLGLVAVLVQEAALYDFRAPVLSSPLPVAGVWLVSLTILVQMAAGIWWA